MSLIILCGIGGVGKGTLINNLHLSHPEVKRLSLTKLLMQHFGITPKDKDFEPDPSMYKKLESIPQEIKLQVVNSPEFISKLKEYKQDKNQVHILEVHLAVPTGNTNKFEPFLPEVTLKKEYADAVINLVGDPEEVLARRSDDSSMGIRERPGLLEIEPLSEEETISNTVWDEIIKTSDVPKVLQICNRNGAIESVTKEVEKVIFEE